MANVLSGENMQQVVALGKLGWPLRRIEEATGVRWETASGYLKAAGVPAPQASACEPYRDMVERAIASGRNTKAILQDLVEAFGFTAR